MSEEIKEILDKLNKTADKHLFVICSSQKELDEIPKYTANFLSVNDKQAKLLLNYITNLQQKVEQLENIRKEAIAYIQENYNELTDYLYIDKKEIVDDLLNILNKGSDK